MKPGDDVWVTNVRDIYVRNPKYAGHRGKRDARSGSCVGRSQHLRAIHQIISVGRGGDAVWRVSRAAGDIALLSGRDRLDIGD